MELNSEQIKKAMECCNSEGHICGKCPYESVRIGISCRDKLIRDALALINSQEQRIKELTEENERLKAENARYEAENHAQFDKWLKLEEATKRHHSELFEEAKIVVKEDTVRKMQELISEHATNGYPRKVRLDVIDQIAKEMLEEK